MALVFYWSGCCIFSMNTVLMDEPLWCTFWRVAEKFVIKILALQASVVPSPPPLPSLPQVWSVDSYQLWLLPRGEQLFQHSKLVDPTPAGDGSGSDGKVLIAGSHLVVINFVKSSFINNPVTVSIWIINNNTCYFIVNCVVKMSLKCCILICTCTCHVMWLTCNVMWLTCHIMWLLRYISLDQSWASHTSLLWSGLSCPSPCPSP